MPDATTNLALPFLAAAQAQKHVTVNESLLRLDALVQAVVESATLAAQPASPADGTLYILPPGKSGAAWGPMANGALAYYRDGVWEALAPRHGFRVWVRDAEILQVFDGTTWRRAARERLAAARTYYVRADGDDANDGRANTAAGAFATISRGLGAVRDDLDLNGYDVVVQVAAGTFTETLSLQGDWIGAGSVTLRGNVGAPANVTLRTTTTADVLVLADGARLALEGVTLASPGGGALARVSCGARLSISGAISIGATAGPHVVAVQAGVVDIAASYAITGSGAAHWMALDGGVIEAGSITCDARRNADVFHCLCCRRALRDD
jgi:hypothetical protein